MKQRVTGLFCFSDFKIVFWFCRKDEVLPDALSLMEETEGAPDPLFGVMHLDLLSPTALIQVGGRRPDDVSDSCLFVDVNSFLPLLSDEPRVSERSVS